MAVVTMKNLLESGVHFGHQTKRWDPRMKKYIFAERNGIAEFMLAFLAHVSLGCEFFVGT